jgi:FkbM family methyltransferase
VPPYGLDLTFTIDPQDLFQAEIWTGAYQPHVRSFLMSTIRPGDRVLCAGLHVGYIAAIARRLAGPDGLVLSAEPDPTARALAARNLTLCERASDAPIHILDAGLSDRAAELQFNKSQTLGHSSFGTRHHLDRAITVSVRRADDWLKGLGVRELDVMVLDVEGWELHALEGMRDVVEASPRLRALVEANAWALADAGSSIGALLDWWHARGFEVRWAETADPRKPFGLDATPIASLDGATASDVLCTRRLDAS